MSQALLLLVFALARPAFADEARPGVVAEAAQPDPSAAWATELQARRARGIEVLAAYEAAGVFPVPNGAPGFQHQFVDAWGHPCAVAQMIIASGHVDLVNATSAAQNDVVLAELTDGPLVAWMLTSGFTREEIAIIQEPGWNGNFASNGDIYDPTPVNTPEEIARVKAHLQAVLPLLRVDTEKALAKAQRRLGARALQPPSPLPTI